MPTRLLPSIFGEESENPHYKECCTVRAHFERDLGLEAFSETDRTISCLRSHDSMELCGGPELETLRETLGEALKAYLGIVTMPVTALTQRSDTHCAREYGIQQFCNAQASPQSVRSGIATSTAIAIARSVTTKPRIAPSRARPSRALARNMSSWSGTP
jgi:hypothetical protein